MFLEYMSLLWVKRVGRNNTVINFIAWALAASLILLGYYIFDPWGLNNQPGWPPVALALLRIFGAATVAGGILAFGGWLYTSDRRDRVIFVFWLSVVAVLYCVAWPGFLMSDSVSALKYSLEYPFHLWLGFFTPFVYSSILQIVPHVSAIAFVQLLFAAVVFTYVARTIHDFTGTSFFPALFCVLIIFSPAVVANIALLSRDTPFSLVVLWLAAFIIRRSQDRENPAGYVVAGVMGGLAVAWRGADGWIVVFALLPILFVIIRKWRPALHCAVAAFGTAAIFAIILPKFLGLQGHEFGYRVANTLNPIGYVLQSKQHTDRLGNLPHLAQVLDLERVEALQTPYEIPAWWSGGVINEGLSDVQKGTYARYVLSFLRENVGVFLAGRMETFLAASGLNQTGFRYGDLYTRGWPTTWVPPESVNVDLNRQRPLQAMFEPLRDWIAKSARYEPSWNGGTVWWWNFTPWLILLVIVACWSSMALGLRLCAILALSRVPIIFLAAPASQFKYYFSVQLVGMLVLTIVLAMGARLIWALTKSKRESGIRSAHTDIAISH
ncbi:hypothetical protein [Cupriavidus necator]